MAIRSNDGYWESHSPYFPDKPDVPDDEWDTLLDGAREVGVPAD